METLVNDETRTEANEQLIDKAGTFLKFAEAIEKLLRTLLVSLIVFFGPGQGFHGTLAS